MFSPQLLSKKFLIVRELSELLHADGRTDRHDEVHNRFSQFCGSAYKMRSRWRLYSAPILLGWTIQRWWDG